MASTSGDPALAPDGASGARQLHAIGGLLQQAHLQARAAANQAMRPHGVELRHLGVLAHVAELGPRTQRQLADALALDKSAMVRIVDELERQGLAERRRPEADRRSYEIAITAEGRERLRAAGASAGRAMDDLLSVFTPGERAQLARLLERFVAHARRRQRQGRTSA